jgi:putative drug exporter of the RND superfamily
MISLAKFSIRRPRAALTMWLVVAVTLTLIGFGVSNTLSPTITVVPGTQSSRATQLANATFGPSQLIPIMLEGPKAQLNKQGPNLVRALAKRANTRVLSAWDAGTASAGLRPTPNAAMMVVSVDRSENNVVQYDEPQIESIVAHQITGPVKAYITGQPSIDRAERTASISNLRSTELITIGILFLLLLIGLRAPIAAAIVAATGAISMLSGFGEVALLGHVISVDPVGVAAGTMTGLALGVGFALLILDRLHREEHLDGAHPRDAVTAAAAELRSTGRGVLVGGSALILAMLLVAAIGPTQLMVSVGAGVIASAAFAIGGAVVVMPAALVLLGRRVDAFSFPAPAPVVRAWSRLLDGGGWVTRHAILAGAAATVLLAAVAVPAFALNSGPESVSQLPASSKARIAFEEISRVMGPGWATPYDVIIVANDRPITTPALLASIYRFETKIADDKTVSSVSGPGQINSTSKQLKAFGPGLKHSVKISDQSKSQLLQLINGLKQAGAGSAQLQSGLASASSGAGLLNSGSGTAQSGAGQLHSGLAQAKTGSATLATGLGTALNAANKLKAGAGQALSGATQLASGLGKGAPQVKAGLPAIGTLASDTLAAMNQIKATRGDAQGAQSSVTSALAALSEISTGRSDPEFQQLQAALQETNSDVSAVNKGLGGAASSASGAAFIASGVKSQVDALAPQLTAAATGAAQLESGLVELRNGNAQLAAGMKQLAGGGSTLTNGLSQLTAGAGALQIGLGQLTTGTGQLATGLASGVSPAGQLTTGLATMQAAVFKARGQIPSTAAIKALERQSPGIFSSGYFVLSAVAGSTPSNRNAATFTINLLRGGTAGQILVISKYAFSDPRAQALGNTLASLGTTFARHNNAQVAVGGPAGSLGDLTSVTKSKIPLDIVLITLAIVLVLGLALRAVLLPAVATIFSLLVAGSTFGVLQLLFGGSNPVLGGPGYLDPITIISVFTIAFGVTIIYSTLLLMQTRAVYISEPGVRHAVRKGLRQTAAATTGSGLVMAAAVIPFATTHLINIRQLGIGVVVAILLEILIVRPVLLPAAEAVLGRAGWWPTSSASPTEGRGRRDPVTDEPDRGAPRASDVGPLPGELDDAPARTNGVPTPA